MRIRLLVNNMIMKFFISSTYSDLKEYRKTAINMLSGLCCSITAMEFFHASQSTPKEICLSELKRSDILIGIYGARYGSLDEESGISMTEMEYIKAQDWNIPVLAFVGDWEKDERQSRFIRRIYDDKINCASFSTRSGFADALNESLKKYFGGLEGYDYYSLWEEIFEAEKKIDGCFHMKPFLMGEEEECILELCRISEFLKTHLQTGRENIHRLDIICAYLKLCRIRERLLEEQWTESLRKEAIRAKDDYIKVIESIEFSG